MKSICFNMSYMNKSVKLIQQKGIYMRSRILIDLSDLDLAFVDFLKAKIIVWLDRFWAYFLTVYVKQVNILQAIYLDGIFSGWKPFALKRCVNLQNKACKINITDKL